jgi:hypothetical protein
MIRRRWLQFSLRGFLIVVTIGCVLLVWKIEPEVRLREAMKAIEAKGGQFIYVVDEADATHTYRKQWVAYDFEIKEPKGLPIGLMLHEMTVSRDDLRMISRLGSLQILDISDAKFSDDDLGDLRRLKNLRNLTLPINRAFSKAIEELKPHLPNCEFSY